MSPDALSAPADGSGRRSGRSGTERQPVAERLFALLERAKAEAPADGGSKTRDLTEDPDVVAVVRQAAQVRLRRRIKTFQQPFIDESDIVSYLDEAIIEALRRIDVTLDVPQIMSFLYRKFDYAIQDAIRAGDPLPRRLRAKTQDFQRLVLARERQIGRQLTDDERRQIAMHVISPRQQKGADRHQLVALLVQGFQQQPLEEDDYLADSSDLESDYQQSHRLQAMHIIGAKIEEDDMFAAFARMVTDGVRTYGGIYATVQALLRDAMIRLHLTDDGDD